MCEEKQQTNVDILHYARPMISVTGLVVVVVSVHISTHLNIDRLLR